MYSLIGSTHCRKDLLNRTAFCTNHQSTETWMQVGYAWCGVRHPCTELLLEQFEEGPTFSSLPQECHQFELQAWNHTWKTRIKKSLMHREYLSCPTCRHVVQHVRSPSGCCVQWLLSPWYSRILTNNQPSSWRDHEYTPQKCEMSKCMVGNIYLQNQSWSTIFHPFRSHYQPPLPTTNHWSSAAAPRFVRSLGRWIPRDAGSSAAASYGTVNRDVGIT